ncbi:MAG: EamA family transporter [bacterium]|nr:EamA family transporter [bacterium]
MRGKWLILLAAVLWGTTGTAQELGSDGSSPLVVGSLRLLLGAGALILISAFGAREAGWRWLVRPATLVSAIGMASYQPFFFSGVDRTGVAVGTLLAIGSAPVFVGAIESARSGVWPRRTWLRATVPAVSGLTILVLAQGGAVVDGLGALLSLVAGLSYAVYVVSAGRLARSGPAHRSVAVTFCLAAVILAPVVLTRDISFVTSPRGATTTLWLGLATTAAAYLVFTAGLQVTDTITAATLTLGEPVTATLLAVLVVGETVSTIGWAGIALTILGLALAARNTNHPHETHGSSRPGPYRSFRRTW